jgi:hypothetical protein
MRRSFWTKSTKAFIKFDTIEFDENFKQARQALFWPRFSPRQHGYRIGNNWRQVSGCAFPATEISPCAANGGENMLAAALAPPIGRRGRSALAFA